MSYFVLPSLLFAIVSFSRLITSVAEERELGFLVILLFLLKEFPLPLGAQESLHYFCYYTVLYQSYRND